LISNSGFRACQGEAATGCGDAGPSRDPGLRVYLHLPAHFPLASNRRAGNDACSQPDIRVIVRVVARRNTHGGQTAVALRASHRHCRERRLPALRIDPDGKRSSSGMPRRVGHRHHATTTVGDNLPRSHVRSPGCGERSPTSARAAAALGLLADTLGIITVFKLCAWLPALGLLTFLLPPTAHARP
jgi:hypothetical protein